MQLALGQVLPVTRSYLWGTTNNIHSSSKVRTWSINNPLEFHTRYLCWGDAAYIFIADFVSIFLQRQSEHLYYQTWDNDFWLFKTSKSMDDTANDIHDHERLCPFTDWSRDTHRHTLFRKQVFFAMKRTHKRYGDKTLSVLFLFLLLSYFIWTIPLHCPYYTLIYLFCHRFLLHSTNFFFSILSYLRSSDMGIKNYAASYSTRLSFLQFQIIDSPAISFICA